MCRNEERNWIRRGALLFTRGCDTALTRSASTVLVMVDEERIYTKAFLPPSVSS